MRRKQYNKNTRIKYISRRYKYGKKIKSNNLRIMIIIILISIILGGLIFLSTIIIKANKKEYEDSIFNSSYKSQNTFVLETNIPEIKDTIEPQEAIIEQNSEESIIEYYQDVIVSNKEKLIVNVNAEIVNSEKETATLFMSSPRNITKEEFENFANIITNGAQLYIYDSVNGDSTDVPYTGELRVKESNLYYTTITHLKANIDNNKTAIISFYQTITQAESKIIFQNLDKDYEYNIFIPYEGNTAKNISISYENALSKAQDIINQIDNSGELKLASSMIAYSTDNGLTEETSPRAYDFIFTRKYNDLFELPLMTLPDPDMYEENFRLTTSEYFEIRIDDNGIEYCIWSSPCEVDQTKKQSYELLEFNEVQEIFENYCESELTFYGEKQEEFLFNVSRIELNYVTIPSDDNYQTLNVIPVWDFILYDPPSVYINTKGNLLPEEGKDVSIVTINAIDGTIVIRNPRVLYKVLN